MLVGCWWVRGRRVWMQVQVQVQVHGWEHERELVLTLVGRRGGRGQPGGAEQPSQRSLATNVVAAQMERPARRRAPRPGIVFVDEAFGERRMRQAPGVRGTMDPNLRRYG